jgi:hypothetical protein
MLLPPATAGSSLNQRARLLIYFTRTQGTFLSPAWVNWIEKHGSLAAPMTWPGSPHFCNTQTYGNQFGPINLAVVV